MGNVFTVSEQPDSTVTRLRGAFFRFDNRLLFGTLAGLCKLLFHIPFRDRLTLDITLNRVQGLGTLFSPRRNCSITLGKILSFVLQ